MASLSFRIPARRLDGGTPRGCRPHRVPSPGQKSPSGEPRPMNAEAAALIALRRLGAAANDRSDVPSGDEGEEFSCSGWFNSTWELAQGLEIREGLPTDLPLEGWLELYLAQQPMIGAVSAA